MFDPVGVLDVDPAGKSEDGFMEEALLDGVDDIEWEPDLAVIYTEPARLAGVRDDLRARGAKISDAYLGMRPKNKIELHGADLTAALAFLDALDEHEDVQRVFSNLDFSHIPAEALA
jgi:transcriptional/translational regulatory protein YebC/TACO1